MSEFAPEHLSPEIQELLLLTELIGYVREHHQIAVDYQQSLLDAAHRARQPIDATNVVIYSAYENEHVPARHNRIVWGPKYKAEPEQGIARVTMRIPVTNDEYYPSLPVAEREWWNDVFVEIEDTQGRSQDFLLNSKGMQPFDDADTDVIDDRNYGQTLDLFSVYHPETKVSRVDVTPAILSRVLHNYVYHPQSNED